MRTCIGNCLPGTVNRSAVTTTSSIWTNVLPVSGTFARRLSTPREIELAIWFHDAIYDSKRKDNEERSADWARREAIRFGVPRESAERIHSLILATEHQEAPVTQDAKILLDADLAILGAAPARFDQYEQQVREEYSWVPGFVFRRKRRELLSRLLGRKAIYATELLRARYEQLARDNLKRSLGRL